MEGLGRQAIRTGYVTIGQPTLMNQLAVAALAAMMIAHAAPAVAHPVPFSYVDLHLQPGSFDAVIVAHIFDVGHDLNVDPADRLLDPSFLDGERARIVALLSARLHLVADATALEASSWSRVEPLVDRQSVRVSARYALTGPPGTLVLDTRLFPYDAAHQTFVNVYENDVLTLQAILDPVKTRLEYFSGSREGTLAVFQRFVPSGIRHIALGPDHLLFLLGVLLLGGSRRQLTWLAGGFAAGNAVAFALTVLSLLHLPPRIIEPAVALSVVYVGADNLMVRGGRDMRVWIATAFGLIHGFWFANGLREMDLPARAFRWSLASFDIGIEVGHIVVILTLGLMVAALRTRSPKAARGLAYIGSALVIVAGAYLFVQRVFFPGGIV